MNLTFEVSTGILKDPKFRALARELKEANAALALLKLFSFTALYRPDGDLTGIDPEEIGLTPRAWAALCTAKGPMDALPFVSNPLFFPPIPPKTDLESSVSEGMAAKNRVYVVGWERWNSWASGVKRRSQAARIAGYASGKAREDAETHERPLRTRVANGSNEPSERERGRAFPDSVQEVTPNTDTRLGGAGGADSRPKPLIGGLVPVPKKAPPTPKSSKGPNAKTPEQIAWLEEAFGRFYPMYPRKESKDDAWKAFVELDPDEGTLVLIARDIVRRVKEREWRPDDAEARFKIPFPATYLRSKRWIRE